MSSRNLLNAVHRTAACIATSAAILLLQVPPSAQAGEIVTRDCLHGSAESHNFADSNQYGEEYGSGYGDRHGTSYSYTRPDNFRSLRGFGFRRGFVANSTNPNGGGSISGADSGSGSGYRGGSSNGYAAGSRSGYGEDSCVEIRRDLANPYIIHVPPPATEKDVADIAARERLWQARCRPIIRQDAHGVRRYQYAVAGCDYGKYE
jgi:hypothetical protein